jgi:hypothetical protein
MPLSLSVLVDTCEKAGKKYNAVAVKRSVSFLFIVL